MTLYFVRDGDTLRAYNAETREEVTERVMRPVTSRCTGCELCFKVEYCFCPYCGTMRPGAKPRDAEGRIRWTG